MHRAYRLHVHKNSSSLNKKKSFSTSYAPVIKNQKEF